MMEQLKHLKLLIMGNLSYPHKFPTFWSSQFRLEKWVRETAQKYNDILAVVIKHEQKEVEQEEKEGRVGGMKLNGV